MRFKNINYQFILSSFIFVILFISCKKETTTPSSTSTNTSSINTNELIGVWKYVHIVDNKSYNCSWTFKDDGTMIINDEFDAFSGKTVTYSYDSKTKKLIMGGLVVSQLNWVSSTKFTTFAYNRDTEFTKYIDPFLNNKNTYSYDFLFDGKNYTWKGLVTDTTGSSRTLVGNTVYFISKSSGFYLFISFKSTKPGIEILDSTSIYDVFKGSAVQLSNSKGSYSLNNGGNCKLNIIQYDTINHILKGNINGIVVNQWDKNDKKTISGSFISALYPSIKFN